MERGTVKVDGGTLEIFIDRTGGGPWICSTHPYLVEGPALNATSLGASLAAAGNLVLVNPRAAGGSSADADERRLTMSQLVDDLEHVRRQVVGTARWIFAGTSMGGFVGMQYALRYPEALSGLIINGSSPSWRYILEPDCIYNPQNASAAHMREVQARMTKPGADPDLARQWARLAIELSLHQKALIDTFVAGGIGVSAQRLAAVVRECRGLPPHNEPYDVGTRLAEVRAATLITCGRYDTQCPIRLSTLLHEGIVGSRFSIFENSGHFPYFEEHDAYKRTVVEFVEGLARARPVIVG